MEKRGAGCREGRTFAHETGGAAAGGDARARGESRASSVGAAELMTRGGDRGSGRSRARGKAGAEAERDGRDERLSHGPEARVETTVDAKERDTLWTRRTARPTPRKPRARNAELARFWRARANRGESSRHRARDRRSHRTKTETTERCSPAPAVRSRPTPWTAQRTHVSESRRRSQPPSESTPYPSREGTACSTSACRPRRLRFVFSLAHLAGPETPVDPKPPAPLSVASRSSTSTTSGVVMRSRISCATRSPARTSKSVSAWLKRITPTLPR